MEKAEGRDAVLPAGVPGGRLLRHGGRGGGIRRPGGAEQPGLLAEAHYFRGGRGHELCGGAGHHFLPVRAGTGVLSAGDLRLRRGLPAGERRGLADRR